MATPVLIPVSEYLTTSYRPDCEYIDGEVRERNLGETPHSTTQIALAIIFHTNRKAWDIRVFSDVRVQTSEEHFRVPDVVVTRMGVPPGRFLRTPPLICIEILSPQDSLADLQERVDDYLGMGVENIWIIDPMKRKAWVASLSGIEPLRQDALSVPGSPIKVLLADLYMEIDDMAAGR